MTAWWHNALIYQVYPRSFNDSNGDGLGDLPGITAKLDYIADLGADAVWISPFFASPQKDFGYDVSDYRAIHPDYGTMADFDALLEACHARGLKLMIDVVASHCSDQHAWFQESSQSRDNPKADWFVWVDPKPDGTAPTNWLSFFGGQAWSWEPRRQQYYLHNFLKEQPNLNYANPDVVEAMLDVARFWFDKGVDGFRLDAIHTMKADRELIDNLPVEDFVLGEMPQDKQPFFRQRHDTGQLNQPAIQNFTQRLRALADTYGDRYLMGEVHGEDYMAVSDTFTQPGRLHATYNFGLLSWHGLTPDEIGEALGQAHRHFGASQRLTFALSNHDVPRSVSRMALANKVALEDQADLQVMLTQMQTALFSSNCLYQGEELGFEDSDQLAREDLQDPWGIEFYPAFMGRDTCRTPMAWQSTADNGGFSTGKPWLPINGRHQAKAADTQVGRQGSIFERTKAHLAWRKLQPALLEGDFDMMEGPEGTLVFKRGCAKQTLICAFNFNASAVTVEGQTVAPYGAAFIEAA